ncbi:hypothetical protein CSKR_104846 [Clonorchis sinensis]|uniref:G-protein coupled receptors family 1 profile domain-containing protein n=1 Tax=Clonorchis sinensis TaxID=79923 RepID=A0A3R7D183_CLOSI|nr:hypothetical protein CSKR_104846 [Clonorchis sinensis]
MQQTESFYSIIILNDSISCQPAPAHPPDKLRLSHGIISLTLGPLNALLNGICVLIFTHSLWKKSTMSRLLRGLSVIELCMGISLFAYALLDNCSSHLQTYSDLKESIPMGNTTTLDFYPDRHRNYVKHTSIFVLSIWFSLCLLAFQVARNWSVVLLAAYRYDRLCRPISSGSAFTDERICSILVAVVGCSCVLVIPRAFEAAIIICHRTGLFSGVKLLLSDNHIYQIAYLGVVMFIVQAGGPVICVCVLNAFIIRLIVKRRQLQKEKEEKSALRLLNQRSISEVSGRGNESVQNARFSSISKTVNCHVPQKPPPSGDKLIFAVCVCFFIFETPSFFSKILRPYLENNYPVVDSWLSIIANILIYLDSTLNAFVYMASNPTFRKIVSEKLLKYRHLIFGTEPATRSSPNEIVEIERVAPQS